MGELRRSSFGGRLTEGEGACNLLLRNKLEERDGQ